MRPVLTLLLATTLAATAGVAARPPRPTADIIYYNGSVETLDHAFRRADALATRNGRILAVGRARDVFRYSGRRTRHVNLRGRALLPGFVDSHSHLWNDAGSAGLSLQQAQALGLENGITTLGDLFVTPERLDEITTFQAAGELRIRTSLYLAYADNCGGVFGTWYLDHPPVRDPEAMLRIPGIKITSDGGTCGPVAITFPWWSPPLVPPFGNLWFDQPTLDAVVAEADAAGYQVAIHAMGDRARDAAIAAIGNALRGRQNVLRHRIEHDLFMRPDQIESYARTGIVPTLLTSMTCNQNLNPLEEHFPDYVRPWFRPLPSMLAARLPVAWASDWPYRPIDTLQFHLYNLVTRKQVDEDGVTVCEPNDFYASGRVTTKQALRLMTLGGAYALHMESVVGSLEPGKFADLVVLSRDPLDVAPDALKDLVVLSTVIGGRPRYCAAGHEELCGEALAGLTNGGTLLSWH